VSGIHPVARRGRLLVVDDEPFVARAIGIFLGDEHDVTVLTDAPNALRLLDGGERYDVIICDVMMPGMDAESFYRAVGATHPDVLERIVFITGGAFTAKARDFLARVPNECIDKPPDPFALRAMMRRRVADIIERDALQQQTA
jgi:CheY-like chemotaxis protein